MLNAKEEGFNKPPLSLHRSTQRGITAHWAISSPRCIYVNATSVCH
jgi:hypothetical protein